MSSDDCLRVWDALAEHVSADFDAEDQVRCPVSHWFRRHRRAPGRIGCRR
jgi:hypothetical protein